MVVHFQVLFSFSLYLLPLFVLLMQFSSYLSHGCSETENRVVAIREMRGECVMTGVAVIRSGVRAGGRIEGPDE